MLTRAESVEIIAEFRRARRRQRVAEIHWVDAMYQVYITGLVAIVALVFLSSLIGDEPLDDRTIADLLDHGPAFLGTFVAITLFTGLRSGSRGGPLALEAADVRHLLLAPVDRGVALRGPAWRQLRFLTFVGAAGGAAVGQLAMRRLPGSGAAWMATVALFGVVIVVTHFGAALIASGLRLNRWIATIVGGLVLVWSVLDTLGTFTDLPTAPASLIGRLPLWPLEFDAVGLIGPALAAVLVTVGMILITGTSLEAAERRTELVGQLRFAVTLQDLRTVMVLRRQLAQERPRSRPWIPARRDQIARFPVFQRGVRSVMRWPATRIIRVVVLAAIAGFAVRGAWSGTTPLLVAAGILLWVATLDAAEPLGQEVDHPGRTDGFPMRRTELYLQHLPLIGIVSMTTGLIAALTAAVPIGASPVPVGAAVITGLATGLLAGCGSVISVVQGAPSAVNTIAISAPEFAGAGTVMRTALPPAIAIIGTAPLLAARAAAQGAGDPTPTHAAALASIGVAFVALIVGGWVRFREDIQEAIRQAAEDMSPSKAVERMAEERRAEEEREAEALADSRRLAGVDDPDSDGPDDSGAARRPRPKPKPKPRAADTPHGVQGGTSAKPIGRARDRKRTQE